jgi:hypothetical protein
MSTEASAPRSVASARGYLGTAALSAKRPPTDEWSRPPSLLNSGAGPARGRISSLGTSRVVLRLRARAGRVTCGVILVTATGSCPAVCRLRGGPRLPAEPCSWSLQGRRSSPVGHRRRSGPRRRLRSGRESNGLSRRSVSLLFFSREETRVHIHVQSADGEAKVWIEPAIELARNYELSAQDLSRVLQLVSDHEQEIRDAWRSHFGT